MIFLTLVEHIARYSEAVYLRGQIYRREFPAGIVIDESDVVI